MYNPYSSQVQNGMPEANVNMRSNPNAPHQVNGNPYAANNQYYPTQTNEQQHSNNQMHNNNSRMNNQPGSDAGFNSFFNDPTTQMGLQFSQTAFNASQQYMQNNIQQLVSNEDIKYYFKVSNSYVMKKILLILFPYRNKTWVRHTSSNSGNDAAESYSTPRDDVNAPDLYIPTMSFLSYILVWALGEGVKGNFHPELLGYATTRTLAFYAMDVILLRISFYVLGIGAKNSKIWDLVSYTGYKFVPILMLSLVNTLFNQQPLIFKYILLVSLGFSLGFFLMRSLRYVVLPNGSFGGESRLRMQYLFVYCFVVQGLFLWLLV